MKIVRKRLHKGSKNTLSKGMLNKQIVWLYYGLVTILTILMMRPSVEEYPLAIRLAYLAIVFAPLIWAKEFTPFAVTAFYTISYCSFVGLLPFSIIYPFICLLLIWFISRERGKIPLIILISFFYFSFISLVNFDFEETGVLWIGVLMAFMLSTFIHTKKDLTYFAYGFVTVSFVLSVVFLLNIEYFMYAYTHSAEAMDRSGWMNPNDFGGTIACGVIVATGLLVNDHKLSLIPRLFLIITIVLSFMALTLNASRGAMLATIIGCGLFVIFSKISAFKKILIIGSALIFVYLLFTNNYLDLLLLRVQEEADEESGGGRFYIWSQKLILFGEYDFVSKVFGIGQLDCIAIGRHIRTHNDFVTSFISYGVIGVFLFVFSMLHPFFTRFSVKKSVSLLPYMFFLLTESMVLEPFMRGYFVFIVFFLYVCKYSAIYDLIGREKFQLPFNKKVVVMKKGNKKLILKRRK